MIELRDLECVIAIAEMGGINRAADVLATSQPALSKRLQSLEEKIGVTLFNRESRGVSLTGAGEVFLNEGRKLLSHGRDFNEIVNRQCQGLEGKIIVGINPTYEGAFLESTLIRFSQELPSVGLELVISSSPTISNLVDTGQVDFAIGALGYMDENDHDWLESDTLAFEKLYELPLSVLVRKDHPWLESKDATQLFEYDMVSTRPRTGTLKSLQRGYAKAGRKVAIPHIVLEDYGLIKSILLKTTHWSVMVTPTHGHFDDEEKFELVELEQLFPPLHVGLIRRKTWMVTPVAAKFLALVKELVLSPGK